MRQLKITKQITSRDTPSIDKYLQEIGRIHLITPEEEVELATRIKNGDAAALDRLVKSNLRFVVSVAKQYQNQGLTLPDLINEGNIGLIKAAERFDETKGFKFISYAVWWIRQSILQALTEQARLIRLPLNKIGALNRINRSFNTLEQYFEREPSPEEVAEDLEIAPDDVKSLIRSSSKHLSMDAPFQDENDGGSLIDLMPNTDSPAPDKDLIDESLKIEIERALEKLSQREANVVRWYDGHNRPTAYTLEEIGDKFCLTRERVRQIKERAIKRLRHISKSKRLKAYLG